MVVHAGEGDGWEDVDDDDHVPGVVPLAREAGRLVVEEGREEVDGGAGGDLGRAVPGGGVADGSGEGEAVEDAAQVASPAARADGSGETAEVVEGDAVAVGEDGLGDGRGGVAGEVEGRGLVGALGADAVPGGEVGGDLVAGVDDEDDGRLGGAEGAADVQRVEGGGAAGGGAPVDAAEPVAGAEGVDVAELGAVAGAS